MKAAEQYFPVVLFSMLYKVVLTCESVDEILKYNRLFKSKRLSGTFQSGCWFLFQFLQPSLYVKFNSVEFNSF